MQLVAAKILIRRETTQRKWKNLFDNEQKNALNFSVYFRLVLYLIKHCELELSLLVPSQIQNNNDSDIKNNIINTIPVFFKRQST